MPGDDSQAFEKFFAELEAIDELLEEGPGEDSQAFLFTIRESLETARKTAQTLTAEDVDREFTEDGDEENDEDEES